MMENVDLPSSIRKVPFFAPLQESPNLYMLPNDFSFNGLIDVYGRDYENRRPRIRTGVGNSEFMRNLSNSATIEMQGFDWVQFLNIRDTEYKRMYVIDPCDEQTAITWTPVNDTFNIRFDSAHKIAWTGSMAFASTGLQSPGIAQADFYAPVSLTDMAYITLYAYLPEYTDSIDIHFGDDSSNYFSAVATTDWQGNRLKKWWNTLIFPIADAFPAGSVISTTIDYFSFIVGALSEQTDYKIGGIYISEDYPYDIRYYSNSIILDQYGERKDNCLPTSDSDVILLNHREHALFLKQFAVISSVDTMTDGWARQFNAYSTALQKAYENFSNEFPSERILVTSPY